MLSKHTLYWITLNDHISSMQVEIYFKKVIKPGVVNTRHNSIDNLVFNLAH